MGTHFESWIGRRYVRARSSNNFVSLISAISMLGIAIAVTVLIVVLSVVNGFERELKDRLLAMTAHANIEGLDGRQVEIWGPVPASMERRAGREELRSHPLVVQAEVTKRQRIHVVAAAGAVQHVGFQHGVERHAGELETDPQAPRRDVAEVGGDAQAADEAGDQGDQSGTHQGPQDCLGDADRHGVTPRPWSESEATAVSPRSRSSSAITRSRRLMKA